MHGNLKEEYFFNFVFQPYLEADQISGITIIGNEVTEQVIKQRDSRKQRTVSSSYCRREAFYGPTMQKEKWKESSWLGFTHRTN
jgi:hypothetical protein